MLQKYILFIVIFPFVSVLPAQILNMEKHRVERDSGNFSALNVNFNFSLFNRSADADNPVNLLGLNNRFQFFRKQGDHGVIFIHQFNYLRINDNPWLNTGFNHLRVHLWRTKKTSMEVYSQHSYDNFRRLNPRMVGGVSARFRGIQDSIFSLTFGAGPMYEHEWWRHPSNDELVEVSFLKLNVYTSFRWSISESIEMNGLLYYQVGYDPSILDARHRMFFSTNLLTRLSKRLSFNTSFEFNYEDKPIIPITKFIFDIRNGLVFRLD